MHGDIEAEMPFSVVFPRFSGPRTRTKTLMRFEPSPSPTRPRVGIDEISHPVALRPRPGRRKRSGVGRRRMLRSGSVLLTNPAIAGGQDRPRVRRVATVRRGSGARSRTPGTPLWNGERKLSSRGELVFKVERTGGDYADIAAEEGDLRGWVPSDQVVPLDAPRPITPGGSRPIPDDAWATWRGRVAFRPANGTGRSPTSMRRSGWPPRVLGVTSGAVPEPRRSRSTRRSPTTPRPSASTRSWPSPFETGESPGTRSGISTGPSRT